MSIAQAWRELSDAASAQVIADSKFRQEARLAFWLCSLGLGIVLVGLGKELLPFGALVAGIGVMAMAWLMAEVVSRPFRLAVPSVVLLVGFVGGSLLASMDLLDHAVQSLTRERVELMPGLDNRKALLTASAVLPTFFATAIYYRRFSVPVAVATMVALLLLGVFSLAINWFPTFIVRWADAATFACGLPILGLAIRFDMTDPSRSTRRSDVAFWLYILAGFVLLSPILGGFDAMASMPDLTTQACLLALLLTLALCAIAMDRRILISAGLFYSGLSLAHLIFKAGRPGFAIPLVLLFTALCMLSLAFYWRPLRAWLLSNPPLGRLRDRLPPVKVRAA